MWNETVKANWMRARRTASISICGVPFGYGDESLAILARRTPSVERHCRFLVPR
jgi:hypothetical protein